MPSRRVGRVGQVPPFSRCRALEASLCGAIQKGFLRQVRYLLEFGRCPDERDTERRTPLIHCALIEDEEWAVGVARTLLEHGATLGLVDVRGLTALHYACLLGRPRLLQVFLGAIDFDLNQRDRLGNTALHYAARGGDTEATELLVTALKKYDLNVDCRNKRGDTPLLQAWKGGNADVAQVLVTSGAEEDVTDRQGRSVRHWQEVALEKVGQDVNKGPARGQSPTSTARSRSRIRSAPPTCRSGRTKPPMPSKETLANKLYRPVSASNLRNQPEFILNVSPKDCFTPETDFTMSHRPSLAVKEPLPASWRGHFRRLVSTYDFQFSPSYRRSVSEADIAAAARPPSPPPSENGSETVSDLASVCSKKSSMASRRGSVLSKSSDRSKKGSVGLKKRSGSFLSVCMAAIPDTWVLRSVCPLWRKLIATKLYMYRCLLNRRCPKYLFSF